MVKFGVIGTNWITEKLVLAGKELEDFQLAAVYSRSRDKGERFAEKFGAEHIFTDLEDMAKSEVIDAVYIASPNSLHSGQAELFLRNGKHVLCEKPAASNTAELKRMIQTAKEHHVLFMEAMKTTFYPNFQQIREHLPRIGKVRQYFAHYCQYDSRYEDYKAGRQANAFDPKLSNGALMDVGVYAIYPMLVLFGKPKSLQASGFLLETGSDASGSIVFTYEDMDAAVLFSKITDSSLPAEIQGEKGSIKIDRISTMDVVELQLRNQEPEIISVAQNNNSLFYELQEFIRLVKSGVTESDINTFQNSMQVMNLLDEARRQMGVVYPADI
ncbi:MULTISPECIES: Gfo/Idh/MocA family protein [Bacillaceae]|uniref:Gfo/Idh/MocA family protein n=1 Tax=Bacillaceae TaxID=186817 RepID=UPI00296532B5|nr:Gfo/Idh/MocA family oxidoreductase [Bacillus infantis]MDW2876684.1 Gfo/Idh/MocA family oxidoreductase [Bacillus infantis]